MDATSKADLSRITIVAGQRSGQPCIRGLRITVWDILDMLSTGLTEDEILQEYPYLVGWPNSFRIRFTSLRSVLSGSHRTRPFGNMRGPVRGHGGSF